MNDKKIVIGHKDYSSTMNNFYDVMLREKPIKTDEEKKELEASFMAMCILLPYDAVVSTIEQFGGIDAVKNDPDKIKHMAELYRVDEQLIQVRINYFPEINKQSVKKQKRIIFGKKRKNI